ncbi:MAG: hypothetical protein AAF790_03345 [Planctomycetota bacterium]
MTARRTHVIKVGGSLLERADAPAAIRAWVDADRQRDPAPLQIIVVGGGQPVDWLRRLDQRGGLGTQAAHDAAIAMMDATALVVASWLPGAVVTDDWRAVSRPAAGDSGGAESPTVFLPRRFLCGVEPTLPGVKLPVGWAVTSDSIAGRIACLLAARLTLLKAQAFATPTRADEWEAAAERGVVDRFFPAVAAGIPQIKIATLGEPGA